MKKKILAILLATLMTAMVLPSIPMATAAIYHQGTAPDDLEITEVKMDDYTLRCSGMGGQYVDIGVFVKNTGDTTITEDFWVELWINEVQYLTELDEERDISPDETVRVPFDNVYIDKGVGEYTLDAYINDDLDTHNYCDFTVTLFGMD